MAAMIDSNVNEEPNDQSLKGQMTEKSMSLSTTWHYMGTPKFIYNPR